MHGFLSENGINETEMNEEEKTNASGTRIFQKRAQKALGTPAMLVPTF